MFGLFLGMNGLYLYLYIMFSLVFLTVLSIILCGIYIGLCTPLSFTILLNHAF